MATPKIHETEKDYEESLTREQILQRQAEEKFRKVMEKNQALRKKFREKIVEFYRKNPRVANDERVLFLTSNYIKPEKAMEPLYNLLTQCLARFFEIMEETEIEEKINPEESELRKKYELFENIVKQFTEVFVSYKQADIKRASGMSFGYGSTQNDVMDFVIRNRTLLMRIPNFVFKDTVVFSGMKADREDESKEEIQIQEIMKREYDVKG